MAKREIIVELQLSDKNAVAELGRLEVETKQYQRELKALNAEIAKNGTATRAQQEAVGTLNATIRRNQTVIRELKNDLSGATAAGLRFRDKMAEASRAGLAEFGIQAASIAGVTAAVIGLTKEMFALAGEIEKVDARNRAIAGESLPAFEKAAEKSANAIGLTRREYVSLAADQALRLKQLGIEGDLLESLSIQTVDYADKLSDFSAGSLTTEQAAGLLNDALTGQTRGLKELGINVKASKDEIETLALQIQSSEGVTHDQATALANLRLAFDATAETMKVFGDEVLAIDAAQDAATARFNEAKEALASSLTPAFTGATEAGAGLLRIITDIAEGFSRALDSEESFTQRFDGFIDAMDSIPVTAGGIGLLGNALGKLRDLFGRDLPDAAKAGENAFEDLAEKTEDVTRGGGYLGDAISAGLAAMRKSTEATEESTDATDKKTEAVKKLTAAQLAQIDAENAVRGDARENIFAQTGDGTTTPAVELQKEEEAELDSIVEQGLANRNALREDARIRDIKGITDLNAERALLEAEWQSGSISSYEEYLARKDNLRQAEVENEMMAAAAISDLFGTIAAAYDKDSAEFKVFATAQALISTYLAATKALASAPPPYNYALAAATVAAGLANVAKIQGFKEGGYTSKRQRDDAPVGVVHANEYVIPAPIVRSPRARRMIDELERMRLGHPVRYAPPYIGGGATNNVRFVRGAGMAPVGVGSSEIASADLTRAIMNMPPPVVRVDEINRVQRRVSVIENRSRI